MFSNSQVTALTNAFVALQNRMAAAFSNDFREHSVLVSVSVSDHAGNVLQTIEPSGKTSSHSIGSVSDMTQFATGIQLNSNEKRIAAMCEVAAYCFALAEDDGCVINATWQDTPSWSGTTMDYVAQAFMNNGKLLVKEVDVADRS